MLPTGLRFIVEIVNNRVFGAPVYDGRCIRDFEMSAYLSDKSRDGSEALLSD